MYVLRVSGELDTLFTFNDTLRFLKIAAYFMHNFT